MTALVRRLRSEEHGFSLTELMMAMVIGSIVLWALMTIFVSGLNGSMRVGDRVEADQRARVAMDRMTTLLDSQVCFDSSTAPLDTGQDSTVTFYANLGAVGATMTKYTLEYDAAAKRINEKQYDGTLNQATQVVSFPAAPSRTRVLATGVVPERDAGGAQVPVFRYYQFAADGTIDPTPLATPVAAASLLDVVRVAVAFQTIPDRTGREDARATMIEGQGVVGSSDPNSPGKGANCS